MIKRPTRPLALPEFIVMMAVIYALVALSIDAMLPALPMIAAELTPDDVNRAQLVVSAFALGLGIGTLFAGPISDRFGRIPIITVGIALYILGAAASAMATSMEAMLAARIVQGIGVAGPRVAGQALIRDLYSGRRMAQISSFVMMIFVLVPSFAPFFGDTIIHFFHWRAIFIAFIIAGVLVSIWVNLRQPETLPVTERRGLTARDMWSGMRDILTRPTVLLYIAAMTFSFVMIISLVSSIQQLYSETYGRAESFPAWFAAGGLLSGVGTIFNATLVMKLGMRRLAMIAYGMQIIVSGLFLGYTLLSGEIIPFYAAFLWVVVTFSIAGMTFGNLMALALEPLGHIAGLAASIIGAVTTIIGIMIAAPIGLAFDGTPLPLLIGTFTCSLLGYACMVETKFLDPERKTKPTDMPPAPPPRH